MKMCIRDRRKGNRDGAGFLSRDARPASIGLAVVVTDSRSGIPTGGRKTAEGESGFANVCNGHNLRRRRTHGSIRERDCAGNFYLGSRALQIKDHRACRVVAGNGQRGGNKPTKGWLEHRGDAAFSRRGDRTNTGIGLAVLAGILSADRDVRNGERRSPFVGDGYFLCNLSLIHI